MSPHMTHNRPMSIRYMPGATTTNTGSNHLDFTCGTCETRWSGYRMAHCTTCHQTFGSVSSFDRHRSRIDETNVHCVPPEDIGLFWVELRRAWCESWSTTEVRVAEETP